VDASTTSFSLVAQFMQTRKWMENWLLWMLIDVVYVAMYVSQGLWLTSLLSAIYLGLAVLGWREWRRPVPLHS
jgi:nicotinamide mononucleotide transporter